MNADNPHHGLSIMLRTLKLPTFAAMHEQVALQSGRDGWTLGQSLRHLCELELEERRARKIERLLKAAALPPDKTLATLGPDAFYRSALAATLGFASWQTRQLQTGLLRQYIRYIVLTSVTLVIGPMLAERTFCWSPTRTGGPQ